MRELYVAVALLNSRGTPTRLVRTGFNSPTFLAGLSSDITRHVLEGDFRDWRYTNPRSREQLRFLSRPERASWKRML